MQIRIDEHVFDKYCSSETLARIVDYDSVSAMWSAVLKEHADDPAVSDRGVRTFAETEADAARVRGFLKSSGIDRGSRVALYMVNSYSFVCSFLGIVTSGASAVLLPPQLPQEAVFGCCMKYGASLLIFDEAGEEKAAFAAERGVKTASAASVLAQDASAPVCECGSKDPCVIIFTGGTSGKSKGALLSNGAVMRGVKNGCYGYEEVFSQRYFLILPLTHVFGLIRNLLTSLYTGSVLHICRNPKDMFREIAEFRPTILVLVPALAEMALALSKQFGKNMLGSSVKAIICGAATVSPYLVEEYHKLGIALYPGYGLTESANLVSGNPVSLRRPESVGFPYPEQELRIEDGELWLKGPNMMECYVQDDEENRAAYTDGWFRTGDLARVDEEGLLYITGRIKEVIVLPSGEKISPAELEAEFNRIPVIADSLVSLEDVLTLQVYPRAAEVKKLDAADVNSYITEKINEVNASLPSHARVSRIVIRTSDFARSPSMKILRDKNKPE